MANEDPRRMARSNEYTLPPGTYLHVQDGTSGKIKTFVGPVVVTLTGSDTPITFEYNDGAADFKPQESLEKALRKSVVAPEGFYAVLMNPAKGDVHPSDAGVGAAPDLQVGHKVVIHGPLMFALWPGQSAKVVRGHHLRSNQYLLCRVYNQEEAVKNWSQAKVVRTVVSTGTVAGTAGESEQKPGQSADASKVTDLTSIQTGLAVGQLLIIRGTDISFYIPPSGITVLPNESGEYVRDAITLEQLQYCILLGEDGNKRYVQGPEVVFPEPTETFIRDGEGMAIFKAIELNEIQGIHVKITSSYQDDVLGEQKEGNEIFITGKHYPIYFPREEHAVVRYDGRTKHFAVAVPEGEARYVMDRLSGHVGLVNGPRMLLPNPVNEVVVRRALSDKECALWYPGNEEVLAYNRALRELARNAPTTRAGAVSEGDFERGSKRKGLADSLAVATASVLGEGQVDQMSYLLGTGRTPTSKNSMMGESRVSSSNVKSMGDEISRASNYTQPRSITLNTKYEGAPRITVWTGFAVMVVNSKGDRKVVQGPANILLGYDETLEALSLSTGKPKTTDKLIDTPYLRTRNNKVADIVSVETSDHVVIDLKVSYLVNFEGDPNQWWNVENYVKYMCDHMRSLLKAKAKAVGVEELYGNPLKIVQQVVLGEEGVAQFKENGMAVSDVELLASTIKDDAVASLLANSQRATVQRTIVMADKRRGLEQRKEEERLKVEEAVAISETTTKQRSLQMTGLVEELKVKLTQVHNAVEEANARATLREAEEGLADIAHDSAMDRQAKSFEQRKVEATEEQRLAIEKLAAEADGVVKRFSAFTGSMSEALLTLSSQRTLVDVAQALSVQKLIGGQNAVDVLGQIFKDTQLGKIMEGIAARAGQPMNGKAIEAGTAQ